MNKQILSILTIILVLPLYYVQFAKSESSPTDQTISEARQNNTSILIGYVNTDSLLENYAYYIELADGLEAKKKQSSKTAQR